MIELCGKEHTSKCRTSQGKDCTFTSSNPIHPKVSWYFWDETWSQEYGPYSTPEAAREALAAYCLYLERGD